MTRWFPTAIAVGDVSGTLWAVAAADEPYDARCATWAIATA